MKVLKATITVPLGDDPKLAKLAAVQVALETLLVKLAESHAGADLVFALVNQRDPK